MQIVVGSKLDIFLQAPAADWEQGTKKNKYYAQHKAIKPQAFASQRFYPVIKEFYTPWKHF
jgi:hypothetical protein